MVTLAHLGLSYTTPAPEKMHRYSVLSLHMARACDAHKVHYDVGMLTSA